jgi:hypothetical protein
MFLFSQEKTIFIFEYSYTINLIIGIIFCCGFKNIVIISNIVNYAEHYQIRKI